MKKFSIFCIIILGALLASACTPNISANSYQSTNANTVTSTTHGVIVNARPVLVKGDSNNLGAITGAVLGGVAGSAIGGGDRMHILGAVAGAGVGGLAGNTIQEKVSQQQGMEYVVKTDAGNLVTVTQGTDTIFRVGQSVYIIGGDHARVIAANS